MAYEYYKKSNFYAPFFKWVQIIEKYRQKSLLILNKNFIFAHTKLNLNGNL